MTRRPPFYALGRRAAMQDAWLAPATAIAAALWIFLVHPIERASRAPVVLS